MTEEARFLKRSAVATRIAFLIAGIAIAAWAPLVPFLKTRANLNDNDLGLLLMLLGAGSLVAMPLGGWMAQRRGCMMPIAFCCGLLCLSLPVLATTSSVALTAVMIFLFGAGLGGLDCVMNIHGLIVERRSNQLLMPGFHAMYSLGSMIGVVFVTLALAMGFSPPLVGVTVSVLLALLLLPSLTFILRDEAKQATILTLPRGPIVLLAFICFTVFLAEGIILDWSAIFTIETWGIDPEYAGSAFLIFAFFMTATRLGGKFLVSQLGCRRVVAIGGLIAVMGVLLIIFSPNLWGGLLGYAIAAIGVANVVPIAFSAVGEQNVMARSQAVSMISLCGYSGTLLGPGVIGILAHHTSLTVSFLFLALMLLVMAVTGWRLAPAKS